MRIALASKATAATLLLSLMPAAAAFADAPIDPQKPTVTAVAGQPILVDFHDGRVAVVKSTTLQLANQVPIHFQVFDSMCSDTRGQQCVYKTSYREVLYFLTWTQNPDATKIGHSVMRKSTDSSGGKSSDPFGSQSSFFGGEKDFAPKISSGLAPAQIVCDDFSWLPEGTKDAPASVSAVRMDTESMDSNPETNANENRTSVTTVNVLFNRVNATTLQNTSIGGITTRFGSALAILIGVGDVTTMTLKSPSNGLCSVELKPAGLGDAAAQVRALEATKPKPEDVKDAYIFGSDEASDSYSNKGNGFADGLKNLLSEVSGYQPASVE